MKAALRAELLKLRTTNTFPGMVAAMVALVSLVTVLHALGLRPPELSTKTTQLRILTEGGELPGAIFAGLLGAMTITGEIRHGTIRPTFLSIPQRGRVIAAKAATSVAAGLVLGVGALVRNQVAAIVGIFVWLLVIENILVDSAPSVSSYMPGVLGRAIIGQQAGALQSPVLAVALLALYTAALTAAGSTTVLRLDFA